MLVSTEEEILWIMKNAIDQLQQEILTRFTRLKDLNSKFGFLLDVHNLFHNKNLDLESLLETCLNLANFYDTDIAAREFFNEICDRKMLLQT